jgi:hypothetical protein
MRYMLDATARAVIMMLVVAFVFLGVSFVRNSRRSQRSKEQQARVGITMVQVWTTERRSNGSRAKSTSRK